VDVEVSTELVVMDVVVAAAETVEEVDGTRVELVCIAYVYGG